MTMQTINQKSTSTALTTFSRLFNNLPVGRKVTLIVVALSLGIAGISYSAYTGLQSLRYQLSNIYDFMLIPIVSINNAETALSNAQLEISQSHSEDLTAAEQAQAVAKLAEQEQTALDVIARYDTEWLTTTSPEFTQALREGNKLGLQEQEIIALANIHSALDAYKGSIDRYLATYANGNADPLLAEEAVKDLEDARTSLITLIDINNQFAEFSNELAINTYQQAIRTNTITLLVSVILGVFLSYLLAISITSRLGELTQSAAALEGGNLDQSVSVTGEDEVGRLGLAFDNMAKQLRETFASLEQRVTARTKDLETVAEVGTATATILESKRLLQEVVDLTKDRFNLYHSHIYLLDENGENLLLTAGAGEPGRIMVSEGRSIPLSREQSLVARAARERKGVTVNDVTQAPDFLPNPLLPDTRSELAVPMIVGNTVIGVFDIQSEQVGRFTDTDVNIQTTLAAQLATSIQNVRSFERSRKEAELQSLANLIGSRIQRTATIEETLQTAIRELGTAIGASRVKASLKPASNRGELVQTVVSAEPNEALES